MERHPGKQLFVDDFFVESLHGARRVLAQPQKLTVDEPLPIVLDQPWEQEQVQFSRVCYDEAARRFRLYYAAWIDGRQLTCALDSDDGLRFERPRLGLVEWDGSRDNNITNCPPGGLNLFWDPRAGDPAQRWKRADNKPTGTGADGAPEWMAYHSADGCDWIAYPRGPHSEQKMLFNFGSPAQTFGGIIDPDAPYVHYSQRGSSRRTRVLGRRDSADGLSWSGLRTVIDQDLDDPPGTEFYGAAFDHANRTDGGARALMLHTFLTDLAEPYEIEDPEAYWGSESGPAALSARVEGFVDTQLAVSRDTVSWKRFRQPLIPRGRPGAWDWGMLYGDTPIVHDGRMWLYYSASSRTHNGRGARLAQGRQAKARSWGKGVAVMRPDGWVGVQAESFAPGQLTTHRFRQEPGGTVRVNVDAAAGELRYEVLADTGEPLPGYGVAECAPIRQDTLDAELRWSGQPGWPAVTEAQRQRLPSLSPKEFYVKLRFHFEPGTTLYSLTLDPPEVTMWQVDVPGRLD